jgi:DNA-binding MarR family transcriptional regulator
MTASALAHLESRRGIGVSLPEYRILVLLDSGVPRRPSELADDLGVTRAAIAQILGRLVAAGLVVRRADREDRRSFNLTLTPKGRRVVRAVLAERATRLRPALATMSKEERRALTATLSRLDAALSHEVQPALDPGRR